MFNKLNYVPSWLDGATTLLQKLNKCIEKIEEINEGGTKIKVDGIINLFEGSETVVVGLNETNDKIKIHLNTEVVQKIDRAILISLGYVS